MERDGQMVGTHGEALLAVEVSVENTDWTHVVWVPYLQYLGTDPERTRTVTLPDDRKITLQFGRVFHGFPGFSVQLVNFEMIAYDHRGAPRDYQSLVRVSPTSPQAQEQFESFEHVTKLNAPLQAPYMWDDNRGLRANIFRRLSNGLNPQQFKLSQAGWDREGWNFTQEAADRGELARPFARYHHSAGRQQPGHPRDRVGRHPDGDRHPVGVLRQAVARAAEKAKFAAMAKPGKAGMVTTGSNTAATEGTGTPVRQA
jgi:hypothetical protein